MKLILIFLALLIIGCAEQTYWTPSNHCDAICYSFDKGNYQFKNSDAINIKGEYEKYICPCDTKNITMKKTKT